MPDYEQAVFISYAWGEETHEREAIVNQLDQSLQKRGLKIVRDSRDLGYKGSIREFMKRIGEGDCVIVVISDKYLRSKNCMFELAEIAENKQFTDRIFPIILDDAKIYNAEDRVDYIAYWENKKAQLNEKLNTLKDKSNTLGILEELHDYDRFHDEIDQLTGTLKDMNCLTPDMLRDADFQQLYSALVDRMSAAAARPEASTKKERKPMDPAALATAATALLAPYLGKVADKALEKIGEQLPEKVAAMWNSVWGKVREKPAAADAANDLVADAEDPDHQQMFKAQLRKLLEKDESFASELTGLIEQTKGDASIDIGGDGVVAQDNSTAVGKVSIGGNVNGNFVIGNNNKINDK